MTTPALSDLATLIEDYYDGAATLPQTRAHLRRHVGWLIDAADLDTLITDARNAWSDVCDFQPGGDRCPHAYLEVPVAPSVDARGLALRFAEDAYDEALRGLVRAEVAA